MEYALIRRDRSLTIEFTTTKYVEILNCSLLESMISCEERSFEVLVACLAQFTAKDDTAYFPNLRTLHIFGVNSQHLDELTCRADV